MRVRSAAALLVLALTTLAFSPPAKAASTCQVSNLAYECTVEASDARAVTLTNIGRQAVQTDGFVNSAAGPATFSYVYRPTLQPGETQEAHRLDPGSAIRLNFRCFTFGGENPRPLDCREFVRVSFLP